MRLIRLSFGVKRLHGRGEGFEVRGQGADVKTS